MTSAASRACAAARISARHTPRRPAVVGPIASKIKIVREKQNRLYIIVKQTLLAYMNGSLPQVAIEFGRKTISSYDRPTIDAVEQSTMNPGGAEMKKAA